MPSSFVLTDEGKKYLKSGLPEKNLIKLLEKPKPMGDLQKSVDNFQIALMWAKKKGLVKISDGNVVLIKNVQSFPEEYALEMINNGKSVNQENLDALLKRNLIKEQRESAYDKAGQMAGKEVTALTQDLIKTGFWKKVDMKPYNVEAKQKYIQFGKAHPYGTFLRDARQKLVEMGFKEMHGPTIETEFWNFDALFQPQNHPSRDWTQTYKMKVPKKGSLPAKDIVDAVKSAHESGWETGSTGWGYRWDPTKASELMPRAHDTAISPRFLSGISGKIEIPGKYFSMVRCYRPDVIDATHGVEFYQMGGFVVAKGLTFRHLIWLLRQFALEFTGSDDVKFYPDYYPFTEPSVQMSVKHPDIGWMELGGAGIFRPELTLPLGVKEPAIAWGLGIDRLAMIKLGIKDIRDMFTQDIELLRRVPCPQ